MLIYLALAVKTECRYSIKDALGIPGYPGNPVHCPAHPEFQRHTPKQVRAVMEADATRPPRTLKCDFVDSSQPPATDLICVSSGCQMRCTSTYSTLKNRRPWKRRLQKMVL